MLNPGKASLLELLLRTMYLLRIHHKITFKSECKVGHPNIMTSVPLPHPSTPYFMMPNPGEVASLGLLLRTMYLSRIHQKTLYGSECKVCCHGCRTKSLCFKQKGNAKEKKEIYSKLIKLLCLAGVHKIRECCKYSVHQHTSCTLV